MIELVSVDDNVITLENIGGKIRDRRMRFGWPAAYLAEKANVSTYSVIKIEQGEVRPRLDTVLPILDVLGYELTIREKEWSQ